MKKTVFRILVLVMTAAVAFTVVHFAVVGNNSPADTAFTFALEDGNAILTGSSDALSGAVMLPDEIEGYPVVGIGDNAFKDCADVTAFFFPDSITSIGDYAFENCSGLLQAILPSGLVSIGDGAFWKCTSLVSVTVPQSVRSIGSCAFYKCSALASLVIPGTQTPVKGALNVALDIGQTISIGNKARQVLDPITTTVYCYADSVAYSDVLQDAYCDYALLNDATAQSAGNVTSYTVRYVNEAGDDVAPSVTLGTQPVGIDVAAVARIADDSEAIYPEDNATDTIELSANAEDNVITFVYSDRSYTITFDTDGGTEREPLVYTKTDETEIGAETTRYGYSLTGWKVAEASADEHYNWGDVDTVYETTDAVTDKYGDVTLKAVWLADSVTITFDANGGTLEENETTVVFGGTYGELADATREGYTFTGWYTEGGVKIEPTTTVTSNEAHTLYANWEINKYNVTVTTDGNGTASAEPAEEVEYAATVTLTAVPNNGYEFLAWETEDAAITDNAFVMPDKAVTVNAAFRAIDYTITFDTDGGDPKEALTYKITDDAVLGGATKTGYSLVCWKVDAKSGNWGNAGTAIPADNSVNGKYGDVTLKAVWKANTLTVTYDAQGGTAAAASKNVTVAGTYGTLAGATREGYTFDGWYTEPNGGTKIEPSTTVTQTVDHTIYARWTINRYNVTLATDNNGFVEASATENVEYNTVVTLSATPKPGFAFAEWISSDVTVENDAFTMPDKAVRVQATFTPIVYTVTFDPDGGDAKAALTYNTTDETLLGDTAKIGYTFTGWQVSVPASEGDYNWGDTQRTYTKDQSVRGKYGDVTLKALWQGNSLTVTYDAQGGTTAAPSKSVTVGSRYGTLTRPSREGYTFDGWYTEPTDGTLINANTIVTATDDHTIYAHWTINKHNVTVTTDGHGTASADLTTNVEYGTTVTLTAEANEGYTFLSWDSSAVTVRDNTFSMPDKSVTVNATFYANNYMIAFDANEGENEMVAIDAQYDADAVLPPCTFERVGWEFLGWALDKDATEPDFTDEATVRNLTANANETVTLYAIWKDVKVELVAKEGTATVIDDERGFIYGLDFNLLTENLLDQYYVIVGNGHLEYDTVAAGTGTTVTLINDNTGETVKEYKLVIFGDLNGDGMMNANDITQMRALSAGMVTYPEDSANYFAADVNHDDLVNTTDTTVLRSAAAGLSDISQVIA